MHTFPRTVFDFHGFVVDSDLPLDADVADAAARVLHGRRQIRLRQVREIPPLPEAASLLLFAPSDGADDDVIKAGRTGDGSVTFSFGDYRMRVSADLGLVEVAMGHDRDMDWLRVLVEGWMVSVLVFLSGRSALHASSVIVDGSLVAFVGDSTQGKSTLAAGLCSLGATLFGDDLLAVECPAVGAEFSGLAIASRGSNALRLRPTAASFTGLAEMGSVRPVGDRTVVSVDRLAPPEMPLQTIFVPWVSPTYTEPSVKWLPPSLAGVELLRFPRIYRWMGRPEQMRELSQLMTIAERVRVGQLLVPAGPESFPAVLDAVRSSLPLTDAPSSSMGKKS